ncbi:MAG: type IV toxin-antitoxin system AbiEi family antitoxin domain-containing protein [Planctomycetota bacterium]
MHMLRDAAMPIFTTYDAVNWLGRGRNSVAGVLKREVAAKRLTRLRRGLYALPSVSGEAIDSLAISQHIYGPSYISMESALSWYSLIPEAVYTVSAVCQRRSNHFSTPLGEFSFQCVPQNILYSGVRQATARDGMTFFIATPLKALCDLLYCNRKDWIRLEHALEDLRIEPSILPSFTASEVSELLMNYRNSRVCSFLSRIKDDV